MSSKYYIVYPRGDRSKLTVIELVDALDYEINDYAVASRNSFFEEKEAVEYAEQLALKNNKIMQYPDGFSDYLD